ncbi:hypothetical protein EYZ11_007572 [Aspergillus tanneri]|uniref:L-tryptophan decarboxylase PsiD-like domain-containing protein n=1 Tax=Aspergillus tanneri TaxID=1220188 RepID=A0A4V3UNX9_9EURO|nr:uncharacterized protein ATNIH1004_005605 [Aspergillus tanneri]KAA8646930.1 hypothetical protein ATNIH1004_005605 [Aspergillus tanneri]THC92954.1 hypothetical protein EYZ11_007572 [Aspergillus tanneri]
MVYSKPTKSFARIANWLPANHSILQSYLSKLKTEIEDIKATRGEILHDDTIIAFRDLVQGDTVLRMLSRAMLTEVPNKEPYNKDPIGRKQIRDFDELLDFMQVTLSKAPTWTDDGYKIGLVGFPLNAVLDWPMATQSGYAFFLNKDVNLALKKILNKWKDYLHTRSSANVLTTDNWFSQEALQKLVDDGNTIEGKTHTFPELYNTRGSTEPPFNFDTWDNFFIREFNENIRPVEWKEDNSVVVNACESKPYALRRNVQEYDNFWLKGQNYSLHEMFEPTKQYVSNYGNKFIGGTVYQAFLSPTTYHRWHAPVSGTIKLHTIVDGTYYSEPTITGFTSSDGPDEAAPDEAQGYLTQVATRAILIIEADNADLGLVAFIAVGMAEVSSCEFTPNIQSGKQLHVTKGEEIGTFHHGGSTHCLVFQKKAKLAWVTEAVPHSVPEETEKNVPLKSALAFVRRKDPNYNPA